MGHGKTTQEGTTGSGQQLGMTVGRGLSLLRRCTGFGTGRFYRHGGTRFYLCPQLELACACLLSALKAHGLLDMIRIFE